MTAHIFIDETKAKGYLIAAASLVHGDLVVPRKRLQGLILPGQRSLHMKDESDSRRRQIVDTIVDLCTSHGLTAVVYDAGREHSERDRRAWCLRAVVDDAATHPTSWLILDRDESLLSWDRQKLIEFARDAGTSDRLTYEHQSRTQEPLLAVPDAIAWCWARGGAWRERIQPIANYVRVGE